MAYEVIKTVKGRQYRYLQESFRRDGRVITRSRYLGPVEEGVRAKVNKVISGANSSSTIAAVEESSEAEIGPSPPIHEEAINPDSAPSVRGLPKKVITTNGADLLKCKIKLQKYSISQSALENRYDRLRSKLNEKGVDGDGLATIELKHGKAVAHKRSGKKYVVTLARRKKAQGTQFRRETSKAMAHAALAQWAKKDDAVYAELSLQMDASFKKTRLCINHYVMNGRDRNRLFKCIAMKFWGEVRQFERSAKTPERLGMLDLDRKKTWQDEAASIYATIQQKGMDRVREEVQKEHDLSTREYRSAVKACGKIHPLNPRRIAAKKRRKRAAARLRAQIEMKNKIGYVEFMLM